MFICNHCLYVKVVVKRLVANAKILQKAGLGIAAVMPNAAELIEADSYKNMKIFAETHGLTLPYLIDETQEAARAYDAVCTPDFFGFDANNELQYRGRLDESGAKPAADNARRDLLEAILLIIQAKQDPFDQISSMGCSIEWRVA